MSRPHSASNGAAGAGADCDDRHRWLAGSDSRQLSSVNRADKVASRQRVARRRVLELQPLSWPKSCRLGWPADGDGGAAGAAVGLAPST